jgi:amidase
MDVGLAYLSATEQAALLRAGNVSSIELVEGYLARSDQLNPHVNGYITIAHEQARAAARDADKALAAGGDLPPFTGVPVSVKDLSDTAGIRTTMGTASYSDRVPESDSTGVAALKRAGYLVLGKSNTAEFGVGSTDPIAYGACRNPWNLQHTTGGSSGGAGATVAAAMCSVGIGSDGGGSVRIPAAFCGVVGVKPSRGRCSSAPKPQNMLAQPGPLSRTVADAAGMLDAIAGYVAGDAYWAPAPERPYVEEAARDPGRLRIAFSTAADRAGTVADNVDAVLSTAKTLESLGHDVFEAPELWPDEVIENTIYLLYPAGFLAMADDLPPLETMDPIFAGLFEHAQTVSLSDYARAETALFTACRDIVRHFQDFDVLLTPTVAYEPARIEDLRTPKEEGRGGILLTSTWNYTGQPAMSLPLHTSVGGLPIGIQIVGRPNDEATLFRLGAQLEQALPWRDRRPASESLIEALSGAAGSAL